VPPGQVGVGLEGVLVATGQGDYWLRWVGGEALAQFGEDLACYLKSKSDMTARELQRAETQAGFTPDKNASELRGDFAANTIARNAKVLETMAAAGYLEFAFGLEQTQAGRAEELAKYAAAYEDTVAMVAAGLTSEMPTDLGDAELTALAETVLGQTQYDIAGWEKMAVVSTPTGRDRIEHRVWNGKIETVVRVWEEFQVTTAERGADGTIRLYHNTIAKFSRAPSTTPLNEWILMLRHEGSPIAEDRL